MPEVMMIKSPRGGLVPFSDDDAEALKKIGSGAPVRCDIKQVRNPLFHKKFFSLVKFLFDIWSESVPQKTYRGEEVTTSLNRFRKDLTILAGHYTPHYNILGEVRLEADSISFANMSQESFEALYSSVIDVALSKVINRPDLNQERVRHLVEQIMQYD